MTWIALVSSDLDYTSIVAPLMIAGCGVSMAIPAAQNSVIGAVGPESVGKAAGVNSMMRELGGVFGVAILVAVFAGTGGYASARTFADGFAPAIAASAALAFVGAVIGLGLPRRRAVPGLRQPAPVFETERSA